MRHHEEPLIDTLLGMALLLGLCGEIVIAMAFLSLLVGR